MLVFGSVWFVYDACRACSYWNGSWSDQSWWILADAFRIRFNAVSQPEAVARQQWSLQLWSYRQKLRHHPHYILLIGLILVWKVHDHLQLATFKANSSSHKRTVTSVALLTDWWLWVFAIKHPHLEPSQYELLVHSWHHIRCAPHCRDCLQSKPLEVLSRHFWRRSIWGPLLIQRIYSVARAEAMRCLPQEGLIFLGIMKAKKAKRVVDGGMVGGEWSCRIYRSGPGSVSRHYAWSVLRSCHTDLQPKAMDTEDWGSNLPSFIGLNCTGAWYCTSQQFHLSNLKSWTRHFQWTIALSSLIIPSCLRRWSSISTWSDKHRPLMSSRDENFRADAEFSEISSQNEAKVDLWRSSRSPLCSCTWWGILANSKMGHVNENEPQATPDCRETRRISNRLATFLLSAPFPATETHLILHIPRYYFK